MKIDGMLSHALEDTSMEARALEGAGYEAIWTGETNQDPFSQLLRAAEATDWVSVGTSIAVALSRSPMTMAYTAYDMARYCKGRFILGLGSQVKAHVMRRFSMPWSHPATRMREFVLAMRAIWSAWQDGEELSFDGEFYTHSLMTPFFSPAVHGFGPPPVYLAGVGERMTEVAGEVCDGFFVHAFTTRAYFDQVTLPALRRGRQASGRSDLDNFSICGPCFVAVGRDEREVAEATRGTTQQIAFYASTPSYRPVLELHGYGDLQPELTRLSKQGRWADMANAVDDRLLNLMAVVGDPATVATQLIHRWGDAYDRMSLTTPYGIDDSLLRDVVNHLRVASGRS